MSELTKIDDKEITTPATLLQVALSQGADLDRLEKLMELQMKYEDNEARKAYSIAISDFRASCPAIDKDKKGHNSKYASLAHTIALIKDHLSAHGLSHSWTTNQSENGLISVTCCVTHKLGYQECTTLSANADSSGSKNAIQAMGSAITYLERYTLFAILGLASGDQDDDGGNTAEIERITEDQALKLHAMITDNDIDIDAVMSWLKKSMKCDRLEDISVKAYDTVLNQIKASIKRKQNAKD